MSNNGVKISLQQLGLSLQDITTTTCVSAIDDALINTLNQVEAEWKRRAQTRLHTTINDYLMGFQTDSIQYMTNGPLSGAVILKGKLPNALEFGYGGFDIKPGLLRSPKAHQGKKGMYMNVPFRHGTPGTLSFGNAMPADVYKQAKKLGPGERLTWNSPPSTSKTGYQHKTNIYSGMVRNQRAHHSFYTTWRRVSSNSDPASWMHPGFGGINIAKDLIPWAEKEFIRNLKSALTAAGY